jgi:hypothetical protein
LQAQLEELKALTAPQLKARLRDAGVEPAEHPQVKLQADLVRLYVNVSLPFLL